MAAVNAAVIRVKRRFNEEPLDALVFACKRRKTEADLTAEDDNPFTTILKFAGTVKNQKENVTKHLSHFKKDVKTLTHPADLAGKLREETTKSSQQSRYKVVNCFRALNDPEKSEKNLTEKPLVEQDAGKDVENVVILDIEDSVAVEEKEGATDNYVYDLYYAGNATENWDDALLDQMVSVHPLPSDLVYEDADSDREYLEGDRDSNDENNSGNEYPDTDESMDEDMCLAMELGEFHIGEELSSDEEDEDYLRCQDANPLDVARYGQGYANYKARITKELYNEVQSSNSDDSS